MSQPAPKNYTIGWICGLPEDYRAACRMLDEKCEGPDTSELNDHNTYAFGSINKHGIVITCLPTGRLGAIYAAGVAYHMIRTFPSLKYALSVGIAGGAPTEGSDIRLGDVVVSQPGIRHGGVINIDLRGRLTDGRFQQIGPLNGPPTALLSAAGNLQLQRMDPRKSDQISENLKLMEDAREYQRPAEDKLYQADYVHTGGKSCANCNNDRLCNRPPRETNRQLAVHFGTIVSSNTIMEDAAERDQYANDPDLRVLCFEREAAGLMNILPCLVIRGICDYSDSHKNDDWHCYAALTAAAYARALLYRLRPTRNP